MKIFDIEIQLEQYEDKFDLIRRYQKYFYIGVILLIGIYLYLTLITSKLNGIKANTETLKKFESVLGQKKAMVKEQENIERVLKGLQLTLIEKENDFFTDEAFKEFSLNILPQLASKARVEIESVDYVKGYLKEKSIWVYTLNVRLNCNYQKLLDFVKLIEQYSKIIQVSGITITRKSLNPLVLEANLNLKAFILKKE